MTSSILSPRYSAMRQASPLRPRVPGMASSAVGMRSMASSLRGAPGGGPGSVSIPAPLASPHHAGSLRGAAVNVQTQPLVVSPQRQSSGPSRQSSNPQRLSSNPHWQCSGSLGHSAGRTAVASSASLCASMGSATSYPVITTPRSPSPTPRRGGVSGGEDSTSRQASAGKPRTGGHWVLEGRDAVIRERWRNVDNGEIAQRLTS